MSAVNCATVIFHACIGALLIERDATSCGLMNMTLTILWSISKHTIRMHRRSQAAKAAKVRWSNHRARLQGGPSDADANREAVAEAAAGCAADGTAAGGSWHRLQGRLSRPSPSLSEDDAGGEDMQTVPCAADAAASSEPAAPVQAASAPEHAGPAAVSVPFPDASRDASAVADQPPVAASSQGGVLPVPVGPAAATRPHASAATGDPVSASPAPALAHESTGNAPARAAPGVAADAAHADAAGGQTTAVETAVDMTVVPSSVTSRADPDGVCSRHF